MDIISLALFGVAFVGTFVLGALAGALFETKLLTEIDNTKKEEPISSLVDQIVSSLNAGEIGWEECSGKAGDKNITVYKNKFLGASFAYDDCRPHLMTPVYRPLVDAEVCALRTAWEGMCLVKMLDKRLALASGDFDAETVKATEKKSAPAGSNELAKVPVPSPTQRQAKVEAEEEVFARKIRNRKKTY